MLSDEQRAEFDQHGFVRVPRVFPDGDAAAMCDRVWEILARRHGIQRNALDTWSVEQPTHLGALRKTDTFAAVGSAALCAAIDDLLGTGAWLRPRDWGGALVTFPHADRAWNVPHAQWHLDFPARGASGLLMGVKILAFIAPALPRGGGTVVLAGSHHLVARFVAQSGPDEPGHSLVVREAIMQADPWLRELTSAGEAAARVHRFMHDGARIDGVSVRVVELTGDPGDAVLMHPWLFHAPAPNCGAAPRMMVSSAVFSRTDTAQLSVGADHDRADAAARRRDAAV